MPGSGGARAEHRRGLLVQAGMARRQEGNQRRRPGQSLQQTDRGQRGERRRRQDHRPDLRGALEHQHRQGQGAEGQGLQAGLGPADDAAEGQRRPQQERRQQGGERDAGMAYHGATFPGSMA